MIQRIQTIFMLLSAFILAPFLYSSFAQINGDLQVLYHLKIWGVYVFNGDQTEKLMALYPLLVVALLSMIFPIFNIFMFKKRRVQIRNNGFVILSNTALLAGMFYYIESIHSNFGSPSFKPDYSFVIFLPALSILFLFFANRFIKKDEALVRSVDRIR